MFQNVEETWKELVQLCEEEENDIAPFGLLLSPSEQRTFFRFITGRVRKEKCFKVLCFLLLRNVFTSLE